MEKIELKDIIGYLPYGLKFKYYDPDRECEEILQLVKIPIDYWDDDYSYFYNGEREYELLPGDAIPILRPLDDLYRPIMHNGEDIVPIVELAKLSLPEYEWDAAADCAIAEEATDNYEKRRSFKYSRICAAFYVGYSHLGDAPNNQYKLFDFLHELKIDYKQLCERGRAIDVNKLDINPYNK